MLKNKVALTLSNGEKAMKATCLAGSPDISFMTAAALHKKTIYVAGCPC